MGRSTSVSFRRPPEEASALRDFPRARLSPDQFLWRVTRKGRGPWWFGSSGAGRFDLAEPEGTCYVATDELAALLEIIGPDRLRGAVSTSFLADRRLHRLRAPRARSLADLTSRRGAAFGLTLEIHTVVAYDLPQSWASRLRDAGNDGLLYFVRHDTGAGKGIALFGRQGERKSWPKGRERSIDRGLVDRLRDECGIATIDVPRLSELRLVEDG